jgi:hypothetical protein
MTRVPHRFTVDNVSFTITTDTFLNIQKRRESILYRSSSNSVNVNLAYVQGEEISSDRNLSIRDRSTILPENRSIIRNRDQLLESVNGFSIETEKFLVTNIFTNPIGSQTKLPLFYKHVPSIELLGVESFVDIKVLDKDFKQVNILELKIDLDEGIVYNNILNTFSNLTGLYNIYFVTYLVRNSTTGVTIRYTEVLNNTPVFRTAEFSDLDEFGNVTSTDVYIIQEDTTSSFSIILPSTQDYGLRRLTEQRLRLVNPPNSGVDDPWFISVQNSHFISAVNTLSGSSILKYRIAEFTAQTYVPYYPYKFTSETSYRVNKRIIKTIRDKVVQDESEGLYVDVFVYDSYENIKFALTSSPSKIGTTTYLPGTNYANVLLGDPTTAGIKPNDTTTPVAASSIDGFGGFIVLPASFEIGENDIIRTDYYYEEDKYEFSFLNLNPLANTDLIKERLVIFVRPEPLGSTLVQTLFYLLVNEDGRVIESNYNLESVEGSLYDGLDIQTAIADEILWYDRTPPSWAEVGSLDFVDEYTVQGSPNDQAFLILGEVYVREATSPESLVLNDIRVRGGGFLPEQESTIESIQPESAWNWDVGMWDGYPYPGAASYFVEIPWYLLEENGGNLNPGMIRNIVQRHTAAGVYPLIHKYNDYEPTITEVDVTISGISLEWTQHPDTTIFDIYTSPFQTGPWDQIATGLNNDPDGNSFFFEILDDTIRYVVITGKDGIDGPIGFSGPIDLTDLGVLEEE